MNIKRIKLQMNALIEAFDISHELGKGRMWLYRDDWGKLDLIGAPPADLELLIVWILHNK